MKNDYTDYTENLFNGLLLIEILKEKKKNSLSVFFYFFFKFFFFNKFVPRLLWFFFLLYIHLYIYTVYISIIYSIYNILRKEKIYM